MIFSNHPKRALIVIVSALAFFAIGGAIAYYNYDNGSVDPRIISARELYNTYDEYAQKNDFKAIFSLLDSIENIYHTIGHYKNSFETGVLYNNRAAVYLSMALYFESQSLSLDGINTLSKDTLLQLSEQESRHSIAIYTEWLDAFQGKSHPVIRQKIQKDFLDGLDFASMGMKDRYLNKRVAELVDAQMETPRRLSVAYTNLGLVKRHQEQYEEAIQNYKLAMDLWNRNLAAENNLNLLLGRPLKKQSVLEKLFPPDKSN